MCLAEVWPAQLRNTEIQSKPNPDLETGIWSRSNSLPRRRCPAGHICGFLSNGGLQDNALIESTFDQFLKHPQKPRLMLVILPKADTALYNWLKCLGDIQRGIHTICI